MTISQSFGVHSAKAFGLTNRQYVFPSSIRTIDFDGYITSIYQRAEGMLECNGKLYRCFTAWRDGNSAAGFSIHDITGATTQLTQRIFPTTSTIVRRFGAANTYVITLTSSSNVLIIYDTVNNTYTYRNGLNFSSDRPSQPVDDNGKFVGGGEYVMARYDPVTNTANYRNYTTVQSTYTRNSKATTKDENGDFYMTGYSYFGATPSDQRLSVYKFANSNFAITPVVCFRPVSGSTTTSVFSTYTAVSQGFAYCGFGDSTYNGCKLAKVNTTTNAVSWSMTYNAGAASTPIAIFFYAGQIIYVYNIGTSLITILGLSAVDGSIFWAKTINQSGSNFDANYATATLSNGRIFIASGPPDNSFDNNYIIINLLNLPPNGVHTSVGGSVTFTIGSTAPTAAAITVQPDTPSNFNWTAGGYASQTMFNWTGTTTAGVTENVYYKEIG